MPRARRPRRLRTRVLAGVVTVALVALAAFDIAAVTVLRGDLIGQVDARLQTVADLYKPPHPQSPAPAQRRAPNFVKSASTPSARPASARPASGQSLPPEHLLPAVLDEYFLAVVHGHGRPIGVIGGGDPGLVPSVPLTSFKATGRPQTVASGNGSGQVRVLAEPYDGGTMIITTSLDEVNATTGRLEAVLAIGSAAAAALVFAGVAWVMRRGLRPFEAIAARADRITGSDLTDAATAGDLTGQITPRDSGTEVGRLGAALNDMLGRIQAFIAEREASQEATRRFFADASHELRNPLASLRANAELYQQGALPRRDQVDEAMRRITAEAQRMSALVDDLLRLARLDQYRAPRTDHVDLTTLVEDCAERVRVTDPARTWDTRAEPGLAVRGDEELLRRAVDNLLANVRCHTPDGTTANITARAAGEMVTVEVSDDGPGVQPDQIARIFDRFYRADAPFPRPGSGLGLAIVAAVAAAHDGTARAAPNPPHGLSITLTLPCQEPATGKPALPTRTAAS